MIATGPVAGLTADVDLRKYRIKRARRRIVVFFKIGTVALRTTGVPILVGAGPVQWISGVH